MPITMFSLIKIPLQSKWDIYLGRHHDDDEKLMENVLLFQFFFAVNL